MNILLEHSRGSILLETLVSIVILGVIVVGSFFSYSFVYQRILSQRQQRIALSLLQGWMEETISKVLDSNDSRDISDKENESREQFREQIPNYFYHDKNSGQNIVFIEPNISIDRIDYENYDMIEIKIWINLSKSEEDALSGKGLPIALWTRIDPERHGR